jgi:hypothetical protein
MGVTANKRLLRNELDEETKTFKEVNHNSNDQTHLCASHNGLIAVTVKQIDAIRSRGRAHESERQNSRKSREREFDLHNVLVLFTGERVVRVGLFDL